jgi:riboflavin kinase
VIDIVGAKVVISYSQGRDGLTRHRRKYPHILLCDLPEEKDLQSLISTLPLELRSFTNDPNSYLATLEVTSSKKIAVADGDFGVEFPLYATGKVVYGFGRGSKQMGIPTANLNPEDLPQELLALPKGVYYGWAQVRAPGLDTRSHMMVMNIGNRPTFADSDAVTLEVHILHDYESADFYGEEAAIVVLGFIRLEMKFNSLDELVGRILEDIATAKNILSSDEVLHSYQSDPFFAS